MIICSLTVTKHFFQSGQLLPAGFVFWGIIKYLYRVFFLKCHAALYDTLMLCFATKEGDSVRCFS